MKCVRDNDDLVFTTVPYESCARDISSSIGVCTLQRGKYCFNYINTLEKFTDRRIYRRRITGDKRCSLELYVQESKESFKNTCSKLEAFKQIF